MGIIKDYLRGRQERKADEWIEQLVRERKKWDDREPRCERCDDWDFPPKWEGTDE